MAFVFTVETGAGLTNSNSYASVAASDDYHAAHVAGSVWSALTNDQKQAALAMAARVLDSSFRFKGYRRKSTQALQWPRYGARNEDEFLGVSAGSVQGERFYGGYWSDSEIPKPVRDAACEMARLLTVSDLTEAPDGVGLKSVDVFEAVKIEFNPSSLRKTVPAFVVAMLRGVGESSGGGGVVCAGLNRS